MKKLIFYFLFIFIISCGNSLASNACWNILGKAWERPFFMDGKTELAFVHLCTDNGYGHAFYSTKFEVDTSEGNCDETRSTCIPHYTQETKDHLSDLVNFLGMAQGDKEFLDKFYTVTTGVAEGLEFASSFGNND